MGNVICRWNAINYKGSQEYGGRPVKGHIIELKDKLLLRKRAIIETINDELKNLCQIEHTRHRSVNNFIMNTLSALIAYCFFPKKPSLNIEEVQTNQLYLSVA
uniref:transposase n=1 Tax=Dyadobacter diqingensis TaxID=2938121 RepID=UPI0020C19293